MNFRPELAEKAMAGEKTVTRRRASDNPRSPWFRERCALKIDHTYAVCPGRGKHAIGRVRIVSIEMRPLSLLDDIEARKEGFVDAAEFFDVFERINGGVDMDEWVWRVEFAVVPPEDFPLWESPTKTHEKG